MLECRPVTLAEVAALAFPDSFTDCVLNAVPS
jgi:hypothetical protein